MQIDFKLPWLSILYAVNVSDDTLLEISSQLYTLDVNGAYGQIELDLQNRTYSGNTTDRALRPFVLYYQIANVKCYL